MVSVIMPCYNASRFIREAIESVQAQTYKDWELLIVDDGSTDDSVSIVERMVASDKRILLFRQTKSGACRARNYGIEQAHGKYVKFLDADDVLLPNALYEQVKQINNLDSRQIPFGDYYNVDEQGSILSEYRFDGQKWLKRNAVDFFFKEWHVLISCPLHRIELLQEIGGFNEELMRGQESELHFRLALADVEWIYYPVKLFQYRQYEAEHRISCSYSRKSKMMLLFREQRMMIYEKLFTEKYGKVPSMYRTYFRDGWFDKARREFAEIARKDGEISLSKSQEYAPMTTFQKIYIVIGKLFGYVCEEYLLRIRLNLLEKELQ